MPDEITTYLRQLKAPRFTREQERELAAKKDAGCRESRELLIRSVLPLAVNVARKYRGHMDLADAIQLANWGAIRGVDKFDASLGFRLTTYALTWMWQAVTKERTSWIGQIRVRQHLFDKGAEAERVAVQERLSQSSIHSEASFDVICERSGFDPVAAAIDNDHQAEIESDMEWVYDQLSEREGFILRSFLEGSEGPQIAADLGISKQRVSQLRRIAMHRLKRLARKRASS